MIRHILLLLCCSYLCLLSNHSLLRVAEREMGGEAEGERGGMVEVPIVGEDESARGVPVFIRATGSCKGHTKLRFPLLANLRLNPWCTGFLVMKI